MIEVVDLCLSFAGRPILQDISFKLENGENLIILGRSGSGKTVLIKTLMGFNTPDSGSVRVDGTDIYADTNPSHKVLNHNFAMVFQNAALLDSFTVFQNVALPLLERGEKDFDKALELTQKSLAEVGLEHTLEKYPAELSGGMRKRVGIARALVYNPKYIIFDEPVSGLDPITSSEVLFYIKRIIHSAQATTITITHDIKNLADIGNRVLFLDEGKALYYGPLDGLYTSKEQALRDFMGSSQ